MCMKQRRKSSNSSSSNKRRKCTPHRSPSATSTDLIFKWPSTTDQIIQLHRTAPFFQSLTFMQSQKQQHQQSPWIVYLRHRVSNNNNNLSPSKDQHMKKRISSDHHLPIVANELSSSSTALSSSTSSSLLPISSSSSSSSSLSPSSSSKRTQQPEHLPTVTSSPFTSGRPVRTKGPCQACHQSAEACMRKAFDWPFPSDDIYYDKGRSFVYLCNKCGLRYNKSGGSVCRHCRWVLCKEEKRKVIQLVDGMRASRPNGKLSLDEDITSFVCNPKYWQCGQPWKVRWVLNDTSMDA
ncbi:uncharacterized protein BX664DRAFT_326384 [Halteromyces radiatus]|uniref:uncharacterized protein n=1 Tax=Halteromyces radiatus TaxID=101107 RepID=UPI00221FA233|nr:uncharacterized protein BX664DRAFT_326384 [Halteromyces radiatus]KAI8097446.1 hypothetical protein BX664DRAFT_326384 [Halteromyces radiatus]